MKINTYQYLDHKVYSWKNRLTYPICFTYTQKFSSNWLEYSFLNLNLKLNKIVKLSSSVMSATLQAPSRYRHPAAPRMHSTLRDHQTARLTRFTTEPLPKARSGIDSNIPQIILSFAECFESYKILYKPSGTWWIVHELCKEKYLSSNPSSDTLTIPISLVQPLLFACRRRLILPYMAHLAHGTDLRIT